MNRTSKFAMGIISGALALGLVAAPSANAENNYAPGLPAPVAGQPNNPPAAAPVAPSVILVSEAVAAKTKPVDLPKPPTAAMGKAPAADVPSKKPVALEVNDLTPGTTYVVKVKRKGGEYGTLGSVVSTAGGAGKMPVFRPGKKGTYVLALIDQTTGKTTYVKVKVS